MSLSPTVEGFRAAFRRPSLTLAEIMWRWATGATAAALFAFGLFEYLNTLPVTNGELLFLRTRQPYLVGEAIAHILRGSLNRAVMTALLAALMLTVLWMVTASMGRAATMQALLEYFRSDVARHVSAAGIPQDGDRVVANNISGKDAFPALLRLNFLRVALAVGAIFGLVGAAILAGFVSPDAHPRPGLALAVILPLTGLICWLWWAFNWLLSVATIFAVRDREDAVGAISAAVDFWRERAGAVSAVTTWTGLAHLAAFMGATSVVSMPLAFAGVLPWRWVVVGVILVTQAYLAFADWIYMARLAGYVWIAETPQVLLAAVPPTPPRTHAPPLQTTIDRDEPILSDLPNLVPGT